ncbi:hypothetical protein PPHE_b0547 [Pseudoalteromonas phenolica O-BC30]|nr:hypothetical protein [Pseudoalteromonas phenolica O-BC30]
MRKSQITITLCSDEKISGEASNIIADNKREEQLTIINKGLITAIKLIDIAKLEAHDNLVPEHNFITNISSPEK